jgi:hypothetical protein
MRFLLRFIFVAFFLTPLAHASIVRTLNLEDLTTRADRIFSGRCVDVREVRHAGLGQTVTYTTFVVTRAVKGDLHERITIKSIGGLGSEGAGRDPFAAVPRFHRGEEVILFLYGDSAAGLTSPVGLGQGKFRIIKNKRGREIALNENGNRTLLQGLSKGAEGRLTAEQRAWKKHGDIRPDSLLDLAASLDRAGEGGTP